MVLVVAIGESAQVHIKASRSFSGLIHTLHRGREGEEGADAGYTFTKQRRHSNSVHQHLEEFRTKFEDVEPEPEMEFEEDESSASVASTASH
jgi:hypothetical protein